MMIWVDHLASGDVKVLPRDSDLGKGCSSFFGNPFTRPSSAAVILSDEA